MSVLKVKNGNQWDIVPAIKGDTGDPAADESITDDMLVTDGIKTEIEWLWGNQLTDSREGEFLHAEDAYTAPAVDISIDGKSTQLTTTGKNLFDRSVEQAGYINSDGGQSLASDWNRSPFIPVVAGTTYTFTPNSTLGANAFGFWYDANQVALSSFPSGPTTQTAPENAAYMRVSYRKSSTDIQLEIGSAATSYEPYSGGVASPRPDWPQAIESIEQAKLNVAGKNLINVVNTDGVVVNGNTITVTGNNRDLFTGTTGRSVAVANLSKLPLLPAGTFAFSCNKTGSSNLYLDFADSEGLVHNIRTSAAADTHMAWKFTLDEPTRITLRATSTTITDLQIEIGDVATEYVPFDSLISVLFNSNAPLRSLPDGTKDELHLSYLRPSTREGWAWYSRELTCKSHAVTFDGSENWVRLDNQDFTDKYFAISNDTTNPLIKGTFSTGAGTQRWTHYVTGNPYSNSNEVAWIFSNTDWDHNTIRTSRPDGIETVYEYKAWLTENPITVVYELRIPTTETLDPIELPIIPSQTVNVWSDPATNLKMTYIQDSNLIIENLEATIADIATS